MTYSAHFSVANGLLDRKHRTKIGNALWVFLTLIDMQTSPAGPTFMPVARSMSSSCSCQIETTPPRALATNRLERARGPPIRFA